MPTRKRSLTRRQWLGIATAAGAGALVGDASVLEPARVTLTRHQLGAGAGKRLRIAQLSDLHLHGVGRHEERVADAVARLRPDLVLITGDAIDGTGDLGYLSAFLDLLASEPRKLAILGNWEHWGRIDLASLERAYARNGCQLLRNESVRLRLGEHTLLVTGLDDLVGGVPDLPAALRGLDWTPNHLLLAHCPVQRDLIRRPDALPLGGPGPVSSRTDIDPRLFHPPYMLAGHTHGGQIAPFGFAPFRPRGSGRYVQGWYRDADTALYVSRGIGTSVIPARLGAPPEVACFDWTLA